MSAGGQIGDHSGGDVEETRRACDDAENRHGIHGGSGRDLALNWGDKAEGESRSIKTQAAGSANAKRHGDEPACAV